MQEERRDLSYIVLDKLLYKNDFIPKKLEIEDYFSENKKLFLIPEKRSFKQFNFKTKVEAEDFKIRINELSNNEIVKFSDKNNIIYNTFENLEKEQVLQELSNEIFALQKNEVSNVVSTALAFHIIILDSVSAERENSFDEVKDQIKLELTNIRVNNYFIDLKSKISQQILDGLTLNEISNKNDLLIKNIKNITLNSEEQDDLIATIISKSFSQNKDFVSDIQDYDNNTSFIINVDNIILSNPKSLEVAFNDLKSDFLISKKFHYAKQIFEKNNFKNSIKNIVKIFNTDSELINIKIDSEILPISIIKNIFDTDVNNLTFSSDEENIYFAEIDSIIIPDSNDEISQLNLISEIKNAFGNEIIKTKSISFNDELINGLLSQYK